MRLLRLRSICHLGLLLDLGHTAAAAEYDAAHVALGIPLDAPLLLPALYAANVAAPSAKLRERRPDHRQRLVYDVPGNLPEHEEANVNDEENPIQLLIAVVSTLLEEVPLR